MSEMESATASSKNCRWMDRKGGDGGSSPTSTLASPRIICTLNGTRNGSMAHVCTWHSRELESPT
jgi:hypothetical protein